MKQPFRQVLGYREWRSDNCCWNTRPSVGQLLPYRVQSSGLLDEMIGMPPCAITASDAAVLELPRQSARARQGIGLHAIIGEIAGTVLKAAVGVGANKPFPIEYPA